MKSEVFLLSLTILLIVKFVVASPYLDHDATAEEYNDNIGNLLKSPQKRFYRDSDRRDDYPIRLLRYGRRSCLVRGDRCDLRPNDCCYKSSCRCNLWGTNCVCERMGLFQQWGKK